MSGLVWDSLDGETRVVQPRWLPLPFSGEMVRATLDGRKTQTRRVMKPQPVPTLPRVDRGLIESPGGENWDVEYPQGWRWQKSKALRCYSAGNEQAFKESMLNSVHCPYGFAPRGDRLWVRERQRVVEVAKTPFSYAIRVRYEADGAERWVKYPDRLKGTPVIGKCLSYGGYRESSRLSLEVTGVRVERLQDITEEGAEAEGINDELAMMTDGLPGPYRQAFECLWDNLNAARGYSWESNPYVWVIEFRRIQVPS